MNMWSMEGNKIQTGIQTVALDPKPLVGDCMLECVG